MAQIALVSPEISVQLCFPAFSNVMGLPKREENKKCVWEMVMISVKPRPPSGLMEGQKPAQGHRIILQRKSAET